MKMETQQTQQTRGRRDGYFTHEVSDFFIRRSARQGPNRLVQMPDTRRCVKVGTVAGCGMGVAGPAEPAETTGPMPCRVA
jgi:hypothetical protein